jgi:hypothetical protein
VRLVRECKNQILSRIYFFYCIILWLYVRTGVVSEAKLYVKLQHKIHKTLHNFHFYEKCIRSVLNCEGWRKQLRPKQTTQDGTKQTL